MRNIIFGFSHPKKWKPGAQLIIFADRKSYKEGEIPISHGYTKFPSPRWDTAFIYQASGHRTNFMAQQYFDSINESVEEYSISVEDDVEAAIGHLCVTREGTPYATGQVIGKAFVWCFSLVMGRTIRNPFSKGIEKADCIEEVANILSKALNIPVPLDMDVVTVKPFRDWIASLPQVVKVK